MVITEELSGNAWSTYQTEMQIELEQSQRALTEINLMLEQSQVELNKLAQRNTAITMHLQQVQSQIDSLPRSDIRMAYDAALDSQQRLFVMRGQLEKLQSDQSHLNRLVYALEKIQQLMEGGEPEKAAGKAGSGASTSVEMLVNAQEAERQRLSRQMHDGPAQALSNFILQTEIAARMLDMDPVRAKEELTNLKNAAMGTFQKVRGFIYELRPMMLDDLGWVPTTSKYIETYKEQSGLDISLVISGMESRLETYQEVMLFRAVQEFLSNAVQHSQATQIKFKINIEDYQVRLSVDDNGKGFNASEIDKGHGLGLRLIRERAEMLGGSMDIDSTPGMGTRITLTLPTMKAGQDQE